MINEFLYEEFTKFILKLKNTPTLEGKTVLDETFVMFGSTMGTGSGAHDPTSWHRVLAGNGGGAFNIVGQKLQYEHYRYGRPFCDLLLTIMRGFGLETDSFGDSRGVIEELLT